MLTHLGSFGSRREALSFCKDELSNKRYEYPVLQLFFDDTWKGNAYLNKEIGKICFYDNLNDLEFMIGEEGRLITR